MKRLYLLISIICLTGSYCLARQPDSVAFSVSKVLGDNMVVQRDKPFTVWGQAPTGHKIEVTVSWSRKSFAATSNSQGVWEVKIPAASANTKAQIIVVKDIVNTAVIRLNNILIGDVWICSGQSNMEMPIDSISPFPGFPGVTDYKAEIAAANYPALRLFKIPYGRSDAPEDNLKHNALWNKCTPDNAGKFSALAYFFARKVHIEINVPIGLVVSALGATSGEEWTARKVIDSDDALKSFYKHDKVSKLYNGMIYPLKKLAVKGFLWDQGEGNRNDPPGMYTRLNSAMIKDWRAIFNQGQLPFYFVQMTPYAAKFFFTNPWGDDPKASDYARFREDQMLVRTHTPNTGMAVNMDIDEIVHIHWQNKKPTGERLALLALNQTYGHKNIQAVGPQYAGHKVNGDKVIIEYVAGTSNGLNAGGKPLAQHFYVAGADSVFRQAAATIRDNIVELAIPEGTPMPVLAVRYAFTNFPVTNLQNSAGLPAEPFRTDKWISN
ncbi:hypothetical protein DJ568_08875 [Mucilaginibacter hurinus]|uniref:Sialate O-acetylesterase domain-containing protein n=1 Tax=Mucilaginibacter hurinus TaxID=2201324 RepID=A0A367GQZ2_9SPHI|nr:sialate O-acetylesterase [Mucilaginibacter hurinus]RCH55286.1 hypothetical protein DJ568_08875 [Mucilaginibacter hurinus]